MPFQSQAQMKWMFANKPQMAQQWAKETPSISSLPPKAVENGFKKVGKKKKKKQQSDYGY